MPANQPTAACPSRQDPFRWPRADIANALDNFANPDHPSQRQHADLLGIPHATFNYWLRHYSPAEDDPMDSFFRSRGGELVLRGCVLRLRRSYPPREGPTRPFLAVLERDAGDRASVRATT